MGKCYLSGGGGGGAGGIHNIFKNMAPPLYMSQFIPVI
uniref:Uncharacterized protein n=1 Tax=Rhizophora mucronata TaxID=61149 RepID=A0A2P2R0U4_RHIMU